MKLQLRDLAFTVGKATLSAGMADPYWLKKYHPSGYGGLRWSLDVETKPRKALDGETWAPRVYHETMRLDIRRWIELAGQVVAWKGPYDRQTGEPRGGFYVWEHGNMPQGRIEFGRRRGVKIAVHWEGLCDVQWRDPYKAKVPFHLDAKATFTGVLLNGSEKDTEESMRDRLA